MSPEELIYDGFNFKNAGIVMIDINHMKIATRINQIEKRANRPGGVLVQSQLSVKYIPVMGYYIGDTPEDAQLMYDILARVINRQQRPLIVPHAGGSRQYIATPENVILEEPNGLNKLTLSFEFVIPDGSAEDVDVTVLVDETVTTATATIPINVGGSVRARPFITITVNTVTGGTAKTMSIRNGRDLIGLNITRTWANGDVVTIDSANFQIYVNGVLTEPDGRMPTWEPGTGSFYYADTFTTRSVDINATHKQGNL